MAPVAVSSDGEAKCRLKHATYLGLDAVALQTLLTDLSEAQP
jgi:hypothetical protein